MSANLFNIASVTRHILNLSVPVVVTVFFASSSFLKSGLLSSCRILKSNPLRRLGGSRPNTLRKIPVIIVPLTLQALSRP